MKEHKTDLAEDSSGIFTLEAEHPRFDRPFAFVELNGSKFPALLDTGADLNAVNSDVAKLACPFTDTFEGVRHRINGVSGNITVTTRVLLTVSIGDIQRRVLFAVVPNLPIPCILGIRFMKRYGIELQLAPRTYTVAGTTCPFVGRNYEPAMEEPISLAASAKQRIQLSVITDFSEMEERAGELLSKYADLFGEKAKIAKGVAPVRVDTGTAKPLAQKLRTMNREKAKLVNSWAQEQLDEGLSEPALSEWGHNVLFVPKKNGQLRPCIDLRAVNSVTTRDAYPMTNIRDVLDTIGRAKVFSTFDMSKGFNHLIIHPDDRHKLAFYAGDHGLLQPVAMPFGMKNAPAAFSRAINAILLPLRGVCVVVYIDDIAVYSVNPDDHLSHLKQFFEICRKSDLVLNPEKMQLFRKEIHILGHIIGHGQVKPDPAKVAALQHFPEPTDVNEIRRFIGSVGWYRTFIPNFSVIAKPLTCQTGERSLFQFGDAERNAFNTLKTAVLNVVLNMPDLGGKFLIQCDASGVGLGAVLMCLPRDSKTSKYMPVSFISRTLQGAEKNYSTTELECLAMVWAIEKFRPYIEFSRFTVETDHIALKWLLAVKIPRGRLARWIMKLQACDFEIKHRPGKTNKQADGLSRAPIDLGGLKDGCIAFMLAWQPYEPGDHDDVFIGDQDGPMISHVVWTTFPALKQFSRDSLIAAQKVDPLLAKVRRFLLADTSEIIKSPSEKALVSSIADAAIVLDDGLIVKYHNHLNVDVIEDELRFERVCLPAGLVIDCMRYYHDSSLGGHLGFDKTYEAIQVKFYWPSMYSQIAKYVASCDLCQKHKYANRQPYGKMISPRVRLPFEKIAVDLIGPMPKSTRGNTHALVIVDTCTNWPEVFPLRSAQVTSKGCIEKTLSVFCKFGFPKLIVSDNGPQFASDLWVSVMRKLGTTAVFTTPYHPQSNPTERRNRDVKTYIRKFCENAHNKWDDRIDEMLYVLRSSPTKSTKLSPAKMLFGRELTGPMDIITSVTADDKTIQPEPSRYLEQIQVRIQNAIKYGMENKELAHRVDKMQYDKHRIEHQFEIGDLVLVDDHPLSRKSEGFAAGLAPKRSGPYRVISKENRLNYRLINVNDDKDLIFAHIAYCTNDSLRFA